MNSKCPAVSVNLIVFKCETTEYSEVGVRTSGGADDKLSGLDRDTEKQPDEQKPALMGKLYQLPKFNNS